jgi:hypothetical protein
MDRDVADVITIRHEYSEELLQRPEKLACEVLPGARLEQLPQDPRASHLAKLEPV